MHSIDHKTGQYLCNEGMHSIDSKAGNIYAMMKCTQYIVKQGIFMQ